MNSPPMASYQIVMLVGGALMLAFAGWIIVYLVKHKRSPTPGVLLVPFAIFMIGFPAVKSFEGFGFKFNVAELQDATSALNQNPEDEKAMKQLESQLSKLEQQTSPEKAPPNVAQALAEGHLALGNTEFAIKWANAAVAKAPNSESARVLLDQARLAETLPADTSRPLPPPERVKLTEAASILSRHRDLTPAARVTLARAQLALGQINAATTNLDLAVKANPKLRLEPKLNQVLEHR